MYLDYNRKLILKNGEEYYAAVEDEMLLQRLFNDFLQLLDQAEEEE